MSPERALLWVGLSAGLLFVALTPPFQAPDEPSHFRRIYQMSEGTLFPSRGGEGSLPESVVRLGETLRGDLPFHPEKRADPRALAAAFSQPLNAAQRIPARVGGAVYSTPFLYLPQALTAWVARQLDLPPLFLFYLCRLVNLATGLALAWAAVRRAPFYRWLFVLLALDPMALFLRSSLSPDASVDALALFFVATVLALAAGEAKPAPGSLAALLGSAALLALSKGAVYLLVPAAALLIPACRLGGRRRAAAVFGALFALTFGGVALAGWAARRADFPGLRPEVATDPAAQLQHILAHPGHFLEVISKSALLQGPGIAFQLVGNLGWLDTPLPKLAALGYALLLLYLAVVEGSPTWVLGARERLLLAALSAGTLFLLFTSQYLLWSAVGGDAVEGVQGRYLLPLAPAAALLFHAAQAARWHRDLERGRAGAWLLAALAVVTLTALGKTWLRYYG